MLKHKLRRGRPADAAVVQRLLRSILSEHRLTTIVAEPEPEVAAFGCSDPLRDDFVAVSGGNVVGFIIVLPLPGGAGEISKVFVARSHRGCGVGTMLIARAIKVAKARDYVGLHLSTLEVFAAARAYYERHGWVRESADGAESIHYSIRLRDLPSLQPPPLPRLLVALLSLLAWATGLRARLLRDLGRTLPEDQRKASSEGQR